MLMRCYKRIALVGTLLWMSLGIVTIGSMALSLPNWRINLLMGTVFIVIGGFLGLRGLAFCKGYAASAIDIRTNLNMRRFLLLDLLSTLGTALIAAGLLAASLDRVFREGFAVFG